MPSNSTLFLAGDIESQKLCRRNVHVQPFLLRHFLYTVLVSSGVNMPAGCYYTSSYTQELVHTYHDLYQPYKDHPPLCELSIGDDRESFADDTNIKGSWFPEEYGYSDNETVSYLTKRISDISPGIRSGKMRTRLTSHISHDIANGSPVREVLYQNLASRVYVAEIVQPLKKVIEVQEYAILPPYIQIELDRHGVSAKQGQKRWLEFILFKSYAQSCEEAYQCYCNNPLSIFYDPAFASIYPYHLDYRDTNLFQQFVNLFPFAGLREIERLDCADILSLKYSPEFGRYLNAYKALVSILKEELQTVILENGIGYEVKKLFRDHEQREFHAYKQNLLSSAADAIILYKTLRNPFTRTKRFLAKLSNSSELPAMQLRACLKDQKSGILQEYIRVIFQQSKQIYHEWRRTSMKNFNLAIGLGNTANQKVINQSQSGAASGSALSVSQNEFKAITAEAMETFKREIFRNTGIDPESREAILTVLNAGYCPTPEEYEAYLKKWKIRKNTFSQNVRKAISAAADVADIASFVSTLMGI